MKLAILATVVAGAAAFAPSTGSVCGCSDRHFSLGVWVGSGD